MLLYLQKLSPVSKLSLKLLSLKLAMLIALTIASRTQSIHLLDIRDMKKGYDIYTLFYRDLLKQSRPGKVNPIEELKTFPCDRRLCVIFALKKYLDKQEIRGSKTSLFLSYIKPHGEITKDSISRWLRTVLYNSGIDYDKFKVYSIGSASTSKVKLNFVPVDKIISVAGCTPASNLGYLAPPQDNFSLVPNCSLGPPGWETKVSSKKIWFGLCEIA